MILRTFLSLTLVCCSLSIYPKAADTTLTKEQRVAVNAVVNKQLKYIGGSSVSALLAGLLFKNDALLGLGIGGTVGTACYVFEDETLWPISWILAYAARLGLVAQLHTTKPEDIILTQEEKFGVNMAAHMFSHRNASEGAIQNTEELIAQGVKNAKTTQLATNCSTLGTWMAYLWLRYVDRQAKQQVIE